MQTPIDNFITFSPCQSKKINLYSCQGKVYGVREFAHLNIPILNSLEQSFLKKNIDLLPEDNPPFAQPLVRNQRLSNGEMEVSAQRSGARSAYIPELNLKIKGCRPENSEFPEWILDDNFQLKVRKIPFGVLQAEGVIREILAYCFIRKYNLTLSCTPVAVLAYGKQGKHGFAIVSITKTDERLESRLHFNNITLHRLLRLHNSGDRLRLLEREAMLAEIDTSYYCKRKTDLLTELNFHGGFRGILNSNIGNELVDKNMIVALCDLDTFKLFLLPTKDERHLIRKFVINTFIELLKSSLPFIDYLDLNGMSKKEIHLALKDYYCHHSSVYLTYRNKFFDWICKKEWDLNLVETFIEEALQLDIAFEILQELIPNSYTFSHFTMDSCYVPHN